MPIQAPAELRPANVNQLFLYLGFALPFVYTSLIIAEKPGPRFLAAYLIVALPLLYALCVGVFARLTPAYDRWAIALLVVVLVGMAVAFLIVHPGLDETGFTLLGVHFDASDADDAIDQALGELLAGRYPYYVVTFNNNPLTPLPGALLLALPFYLLGNSAVQNIAWLGVFAYVAARKTGSYAASAALLFTTLAFAPNLVYHLIQGTDYTANNLYILVFMLLLVDAVESKRGKRRQILSAVLLGIGLAARLNYLLLLPLLYAYLARKSDLRQATKLLAITLATFLVLVLPFYLYDPAGFSPLHTAAIGGGVFAFPLVGAGVATLLLAYSILKTRALAWSRLLQYCFWVQIVLIASSMARISLALDAFIDDYARFGLLAIFFAVLGFGAELCCPVVAVPAMTAPALGQARR